MAMHTLDSISPSSPWLPPDRPLTASASPSPPPPQPLAAAATLQHLRAAGRRIAKRRPRPSRRLPTTYISADPTNFRRMVHQVTGAADLPPPPPTPSTTQQHPELLRHVPTQPDSAGAGALMMLPTLDTSAYLLGRPASAPAPPLALVGGAYTSNNSSSSSSSNCGFPALLSWDLL
ncbi:hypothetical protein GUJ93_ZPchr0011g27274 [Zizania palustris]|uniref:VQ domain-containing protein n=1 Tax=Zizania palustris TaxID=103762 RepID=A0A8J6BJF1_ZIZPA|nr:hypothetical protein GUJ93_ZPchr0011g27274 [Zizania palustris]